MPETIAKFKCDKCSREFDSFEDAEKHESIPVTLLEHETELQIGDSVNPTIDNGFTIGSGSGGSIHDKEIVYFRNDNTHRWGYIVDAKGMPPARRYMFYYGSNGSGRESHYHGWVCPAGLTIGYFCHVCEKNLQEGEGMTCASAECKQKMVELAEYWEDKRNESN